MSTGAPNAAGIVDHLKDLWERFVSGVKKYVDFKGRSSRRDWWGYILFYYIILIILSIVDGIFGWGPILVGLFCLALLLPSLALNWRRLHDLGKSGWYMGALLIGYLAVIIISAILYQLLGAESMVFTVIAGILGILIGIYAIYLFIITGFFRSQSGENKYGPNPYGE